MKTYLSKFFFFLGDILPSKSNFLFYPLYRGLMLLSIYFDTKNIVWGSETNKITKRNDLLAKLVD
jgi:hypothetical protein